MTDWPARPYLADNTLHVCDWLELMQALPDGSVDAIITDPPYGIGIDVFDKPIDTTCFLNEVSRVLKPSGHLAFFHQMPNALDWLNAIPGDLFFKDHIVWVKRVVTALALPLIRSHESFFIYGKKNARYNQTKGRYEDVKVPGVAFDVISIEAIKRHIADLHQRLLGNETETDTTIRHESYSYYPRRGSRSSRYSNFTNVWSFLPPGNSNNEMNTTHATRKPELFLMRACELLTQPGELVVDPFVGSGTTAVAAKITGRRFICGDQSAEYIEIARKRVFPTFGEPPKRKREVKPITDLPLFAALEGES